MANNRDQQEVLLVPVWGVIAKEKDHQEVLLVIGPAMTITNPTAQAKRPQVCVNT